MKITKKQWEIIKGSCKECDLFWKTDSKENNLLCDPATAFEEYGCNLENWADFLDGKNNCWCKSAIMPIYGKE